MSAVLIASAEADGSQAKALAQGLRDLGFDATAHVPVGEGDTSANIRTAIDGAKCVLLCWSEVAARDAALSFEATLALERKKLISAELQKDATPAHFRSAPRAGLAFNNRVRFKAAFEALVADVSQLAETPADAEKMPAVLATLREALARPGDRGKPSRPLLAIGLSIGFLFVVGFGAGRAINAARMGPRTAEADVSAAPVADTKAGLLAPGDAQPWTERILNGDAHSPRYGLSLADLEKLPWREAAAKIAPDQADRIESDAHGGDAFAQTIACLGHLAGTGGFMPSPAAARAFCDAGAEQKHPAALYLSWTLRRTAPQVAPDGAAARERLVAAAQQGWTSAQIDYAQLLAPDFSGPLEAQVEAGRLLLAAAERGDARAQYAYARWLRDSRAGPRDPAAAAPFLEHAAQQGDLEAIHMLATLYRDGQGVARNPQRAQQLYRTAATRGYAPSMFNLADLLRRGTDAEKTQAVTLYAQLSCMSDERQISAMALRRLREMHQVRADC
ncbi:hypothetical protein [Terricaulis sp.]|uniref:hypothetical protein n=1 Tax=Terricaulis sp. TaxID=2768686 RepID=UPI0037843416